jgi:hypothetical protein
MLAWTTLFFLVFCGAILGHIAFRYRRILKVTGYFLKASIAYIIVGDDDAKLAALAASEGIRGKERLTRSEFLRSVETSLADKKDSRLQPQIERCRVLAKTFAGMERDKRALSFRDNLAIKNRPYFTALLAGDQHVFARRHEDLTQPHAGDEAGDQEVAVVASAVQPLADTPVADALRADLGGSGLRWATSQSYATAAESALLRHAASTGQASALQASLMASDAVPEADDSEADAAPPAVPEDRAGA